MHLLDGPSLGHSMTYYDGKLEKKKKAWRPLGFEPSTYNLVEILSSNRGKVARVVIIKNSSVKGFHLNFFGEL